MAYKVDIIDKDKAMKHIQDMKYSLIYNISNVKLEKADKVMDIGWDQCLEARIFNDKSEIRVYRDENDRIVFSYMQEIDSNDIIEEKYELMGKFSTCGKYLIVKEYMKTDEDGQVYTAYRKPARMEA